MSEQSVRVEANFERGPGPGALIAMGILSIALGAFALAFPFWASIGVELVMGAALIVLGIVEMVRARSLGGAGRIAWAVVFGLLAVIAGGLLLFFPLQGVLTLTLVLAVFFLAGGLVKTLSAFQLRPVRGWGWLLTSGLLSLALGLIVLIALPGSAFWVPGVLLGVDLILFGIAQIAFGLGARDSGRAAVGR